MLGIKTVAKNDHDPQSLAKILALRGHRAHGDENWQEPGSPPLDFLVSNGLRRNHNVVQVGSGNLRTGIHLIRYLDTGRYCGIEKDRGRVRDGIERELGRALFESKRPLFILTDRFAFECCDNSPDFVVAESLFAHLDPKSIIMCLQNLRTRITGGCVFFAAFVEAATATLRPAARYGRENFLYTRAQMEIFGMRSGWIPAYVGEWGRPRGMMMMSYRPKPRI